MNSSDVTSSQLFDVAVILAPKNTPASRNISIFCITISKQPSPRTASLSFFNPQRENIGWTFPSSCNFLIVFSLIKEPFVKVINAQSLNSSANSKNSFLAKGSPPTTGIMWIPITSRASVKISLHFSFVKSSLTSYSWAQQPLQLKLHLLVIEDNKTVGGKNPFFLLNSERFLRLSP